MSDAQPAINAAPSMRIDQALHFLREAGGHAIFYASSEEARQPGNSLGFELFRKDTMETALDAIHALSGFRPRPEHCGTSTDARGKKMLMINGFYPRASASTPVEQLIRQRESVRCDEALAKIATFVTANGIRTSRHVRPIEDGSGAFLAEEFIDWLKENPTVLKVQRGTNHTVSIAIRDPMFATSQASPELDARANYFTDRMLALMKYVGHREKVDMFSINMHGRVIDNGTLKYATASSSRFKKVQDHPLFITAQFLADAGVNFAGCEAFKTRHRA